MLIFWKNNKLPTFGRIFITPKPTTMNYSSPDILTGMVRALPQLAIFVACIIFLAKKRRVDSILLFIGSLVGLFSNIFYVIIWPNLAHGDSRSQMLNAIAPLSFLGSLLFVAGFIVLILNTIKERD